MELRSETHKYPEVVATPSVVRKPEEVKSTEILDFTQHVLGNKVIYKKKKYPPFYHSHKSWQIRCRKMEYLRHQDNVRIRMFAEHGELRSFLTDEYPEAKPKHWIKARKTDEVTDEAVNE